MKKRINSVIAGDYDRDVILWDGATLTVSGLMRPVTVLDKSTVAYYSVVDCVRCGFFGRHLAYTVSVDFFDGKRSLMYLSDDFYDTFVRIMF